MSSSVVGAGFSLRVDVDRYCAGWSPRLRYLWPLLRGL